MSRIRPRIDSIASTWADERLADLDRLLGLVAGAGGDVGGDLDLGAGILDRADQAGGGLRGLAHRDRRLLGGGGDFGGLAEHAARGGGGFGGLGADHPAVRGGALDGADDLFLVESRPDARRLALAVGPHEVEMGGEDVGLEQGRLGEALGEAGQPLGHRRRASRRGSCGLPIAAAAIERDGAW